MNVTHPTFIQSQTNAALVKWDKVYSDELAKAKATGIAAFALTPQHVATIALYLAESLTPDQPNSLLQLAIANPWLFSKKATSHGNYETSAADLVRVAMISQITETLVEDTKRIEQGLFAFVTAQVIGDFMDEAIKTLRPVTRDIEGKTALQAATASLRDFRHTSDRVDFDILWQDGKALLPMLDMPDQQLLRYKLRDVLEYAANQVGIFA